MAYLLGVLALVVGLLVSVALHELGHLLPAKAFGIKVPRYFVGIGPTLWSTRRGETEYGLKAIPLGGFVSMAGMYLPRRRRGTDRTRRDGSPTLVQEARHYASEELAPGEEHRAFHRLSVPRKLVVMFGGPLVNLVLAAVLVLVSVSGVGTPEATTRIAHVGQCLPVADPDAPAGGGVRLPAPGAADCTPTPAAEAGLAEGDVVTAWGGAPVTTWDELQAAIETSGTAPLTVEFRRDGAERAASVAPAAVPRPVVDQDGEPVAGPDGEPVLEERPYVGIGATLEIVAQPPGRAWEITGLMLRGTADAILHLPQNLAAAVSSTVTGAERGDGVMSVVGVGRVAGEIASVQAGEGYTAAARTADLLSILASLNIALFVFNMIPLLPLDGGHIAGALVEGLRRTFARLTGRPDPGPTDVARLLPLTYVVGGVLIVMSVVLILVDLINPVRVVG